MKTKEELRVEWITALRSGKYKQGKGQLKTTDGFYCCLGVLCEIVGIMDESGYAKISGEIASGFLPDTLAAHVGVNSAHQLRLATINDGKDLEVEQQCKGFDDIADLLETGEYWDAEA